jgi:aspartyl-tRNA(Asn)/glutamyl-tRNA(Gln) amidotransferase subunit B
MMSPTADPSRNSWEAVIGLEVHVQLATRTKIFCSCPNLFGAEPNTLICPVCTGQPGALPVLNQNALRLALKTALALNLKVRPMSLFARKNYFYPDLPKGYQISQYSLPLAEDGYLEILVQGGMKRIGITRLHLEEDAGKLLHGEVKSRFSYVDFNRAGAPLIEIVSEPDIRSPEEAVLYLKNLRSIVRAISASDADMEKGNFRCDANVSVRRRGETALGTKTELKNLNSFRFVEQALHYEIERQIALLEGGKPVIQETRLFDEGTGKTIGMRRKEEAHDYRYFPEPDLPPLRISLEELENLKKEIPELPLQRLLRFMEQYGLSEYEARILTEEIPLAELFEGVVRDGIPPKKVANWILNELLRYTRSDLEGVVITPQSFAELIRLREEGEISPQVAKELLPRLLREGGSPREIVEKEGLGQLSDERILLEIVSEVLSQNSREVERYRRGEKKLLAFFMGQVMKATRGKASPERVRELLLKELEGS